ncbi:archaemetzincin [Armatimonas sp.]|uniref:archaemetzincin n=1 Tax=Armatimonas sp. TaxID=1872638 RepID=UPI00286B7A6B|nr:archaemetzincin [Armatimonas sp.]
MVRTFLLFLLGLALAGGVFVLLRSQHHQPARVLTQHPNATVRRLAPLYPRFEETDWSVRHPEEQPQTLEAFQAQRTPLADRKTHSFYIQPIGRFGKDQQQLLTDTATLLEHWFGSPVKTLPPRTLESLPQSARRGPQLLTGVLLNQVLLPQRPHDAIAVLGVTTVDLTPGEGWNFVFGQASLVNKVGVWSLARLIDPTGNQARTRLRFFKLATHETGHMYGIEHCLVAKCGMNGCNSIMETDRAPLAFCPECTAKLWHATGLAPKPWFTALEAFGKLHGLKEEALLWQRSREALKP